jgi:hypothetical protein
VYGRVSKKTSTGLPICTRSVFSGGRSDHAHALFQLDGGHDVGRAAGPGRVEGLMAARERVDDAAAAYRNVAPGRASALRAVRVSCTPFVPEAPTAGHGGGHRCFLVVASPAYTSALTPRTGA